MKRCIITVVLVAMICGTAPAQETRRGPEGGQGFQNLSAEDRARFREKWQNMSEAEREKFRAEMRQRFGSGRRGLGREEQLKAIAAIEEHVAKLKAAIETAGLDDRERLRDLSEAERAKLREKTGAAMRQRQRAIREIEEQLARLRGPGQPGPQPGMPVRELRAIQELAVKEKATETAKRLEKLIASYQRQPTDSAQPSCPSRRTRHSSKALRCRRRLKTVRRPFWICTSGKGSSSLGSIRPCAASSPRDSCGSTTPRSARPTRPTTMK